ncbi:FIMAH domain-containing protein [Aureibacillus halotolerans]|uniref:Pectate lyase n=1 Tax=Aureibacillus halotolerans TaxID=1508390 RepID=A0A4R6TUT5_9BACI|nr:pectinesterase [Aureibacillus halotolerans]TDQ34584.1 pectate lyase [Aureibacillus halotolerans]
MKKFMLVLFCIIFGSAIIPVQPLSAHAEDRLLAFPGAEGFGAYSQGGRGGEVYYVTSRELKGPGTFHDALTTAGDTPRTIVFGISGELTIPQIIVRDKSNITIAGQTAPGDGVTIKGNNVRFIDCEDIVIRYLRFRMGTLESQDDAMYVEDSKNVIIDHSSFSWGRDEVLSIKSKNYEDIQSRNITVQWSMMTEGLLTHSMGGLIEMNTITMHHNLYAHNNDRNPKTKGQIDFVNNVVYNWGEYPYVAGGESGTKGYGNVVGNYFVAGINSVDPQYAVVRGNENYSLYLENNRIDSNKNGVLDGTDTGAGMMEKERPSVLMPERFNYPLVHTQEPEDAYEAVLNFAGSSLARDAVDERISREVRTQTGAIIGHEDDAGGFPVLEERTGPTDSDNDGMPDEWELAHGLDPDNSSDRNADRNGDGYTNLEDYLNELAAPGFPDGYSMEPPVWSGPVFTPPEIPEPEVPKKEPLPAKNGELIKNMIINDSEKNAANWSVQQNLQPGDLVAGDRMSDSNGYQFVSIPETLQGSEWIRSAVESRGSTSEDLVSFFLAADADVYVAHDSRISSLPAWLQSYEPTGKSITDDQPIEFKLYKKHFPAGSHVVMGPNNDAKKMNYVVVVKPTATDKDTPNTAPAGLFGEMQSNDTIALQWESVAEAEGYLIYRSSSKDPYVRAVAYTTNATYEDNIIDLGMHYTYQIQAVNAGGPSQTSDAITVLAYEDSQSAPPAPAGLQTTEVNSLSIALSWEAVDEAVSYTVYRSTENSSNAEAIGYSSDATYVDNTVDPSTTYSYYVTAVGTGGQSTASSTTNATTGAPVDLPSVPQALQASDVSPSSNTLTWQTSDQAEQYIVYRKTTSGELYEEIARTTDARYVDDALNVEETGYTYKVTALNEKGETAPSPAIDVAMPQPPAPTDLIVGLAGDTFVGLVWTPQDGASLVNIYREVNGVAESLGTAKVNTFYDRTAESGVEYTYYVKAVNGGGESDASNSVTVRPSPFIQLQSALDVTIDSETFPHSVAKRLTNMLRQATHHWEKGHSTKASDFTEKFITVLAAETTSNPFSSQLHALAQRTLEQLE